MRTASLIIVALGLTSVATAHSPYLLPNKFDVGKRDHVSVQASFTEDYFIPDVAMKSDDYHVLQPDGVRAPLEPVYTRDLAILEVDTKADGTYRISTGNRTGRTGKAALTPDGQWKFFGEREEAPAGGKVHAMQSITRADAFVSRGSPTEAALALSNKGLEFKFLTHPSRLIAGSPVKLKVWFDGQPLGGQLITVQKGELEEGMAGAPAEVRSAADGSVTLPLEKPGIYHVMSRHRLVLPGGDAQAQSHTYAVTLEVAE